MKILLLFTLSQLSAVPPEAGSPPQQNEYRTEVQQVVDSYVLAWGRGDHSQLAKLVEADDGYVIWAGDSDVSSMTFRQILDRPSRKKAGYGEPYEVLSVDVVDGRLAVAKVKIAFSAGHYIDYLVLYRVAGEWKIVAKTFVTRREGQR